MLVQYLGVKNDSTSAEGRSKSSAADEKHKVRRDRFGLMRLDYFNSLRDLALFKECSTLATLAHYVHSVHDILVSSGRDLDRYGRALDELDIGIDALSADIEGAKLRAETSLRILETSVALQRPDFVGAEQQPQLSRKFMDSSATLNRAAPRDSDTYLPSVSPDNQPTWLPYPSPDLVMSPDSVKSRLEVIPSAQLRKKEGFLWANSRPITHQGSADNVRHWQK